MKLHCNIDGLNHNWVDVTEAWTRAEFREMLNAAGEDYFSDWMKKKVTECHIERADGTVITSADELTGDNLDNLDTRVLGFLGTVLIFAHNEILSLGNASARKSSDTSESQKTNAA